MLDGIDQIDWSKLTHGYGPANDIPPLLRALASGDKRASAKAISALYSTILHQGGVYDSTAVVVPFLIEMLAEPRVLGKEHILELLGNIARGIGATLECRAAVAAGTALLVRLLSAKKAALRISAPYVLTACSDRAAEFEPALRQRLPKEKNAKAKASLIMALCQLGDSNDAVLLLCDESQDPLVRLAAALAVLEHGATEAKTQALAVCRATIEACQKAFVTLPWQRCCTPARAIFTALQREPDLQRRWVRGLLDHTNAALRKDALHTLKSLFLTHRSGATMAAPLLGELLSDPDRDVRVVAAMYLLDVGSAARLAVEPLLAALDDESDARDWAIEALGMIGETRALPVLLRILSQPDATSRDLVSVLRALESLGHAALPALPHLRRLTRHHDLGWQAARVLGVIGSDAAAALPELIALLRRPTSLNVTNAALALGRLGAAAQQAAPDLIDVLTGAPDPALDDSRKFAARALGEIGPGASAAIPALLNAMKDADPMLRADAALACWRIGGRPETVLPILENNVIQHLDDKLLPAVHAAHFSLDYLGTMGPAAAPLVPLLLRLLRHDRGGVRIKSARALYQIERRHEPVLPVLLHELRTGDAYSLLFDGLADIGPPAHQALPRLRELIDSDLRLIHDVHKDEQLRAAAVRARARIENERG